MNRSFYFHVLCVEQDAASTIFLFICRFGAESVFNHLRNFCEYSKVLASWKSVWDIGMRGDGVGGTLWFMMV